MAPEVIHVEANNIDVAAGKILGILEGTSEYQRNIYFYGWHVLGASAALKVVAQRLKSSAAQKMKFDKIVHLDCPLWKSMRALQKEVAEELELPRSVMAIFDQQDEEDDFNGIDEGSRWMISDVTVEIFRKLANSRFMVIFHNGSNDYIDLFEYGLPVTNFLSNKVLWTWSGTFQLCLTQEREELERQTDVIMVAEYEGLSHEEWWDLVREEAERVAKYMGILELDMSHKIVECFLYVWARRSDSGIDWGTHASNYWVCDGIIQRQYDTSAWEVGDALQRNMGLDWLLWKINIEREIDDAFRHCLQWRPNDRWVSAKHQDDIGVLPPQATSFFLLSDKLNDRMILPAAMFPHSDNSRLRVLHLSWCTFSFTSPPFLCCSHLRFLLLDHCTNVKEDEHQGHSQDRSCFQKLWVLDLRYTDWYQLLSKEMMHLMAELRELNVKGVKNWSVSDLRGCGPNLVKLQVIDDPAPAGEYNINNQASFPDLSSASRLKTVILESYVGWEQVVPDMMPPSLEAFSFVNKAAAAAKISSISFRGCTHLKSMLLRGSFKHLEELDLSGTAVQTLDLREVKAENLKRLLLLDCEKLRAILWPPGYAREWPGRLEVLRIDTTSRSASTNGGEENLADVTSVRSSSLLVLDGDKAPHAHPRGSRSLQEQKEEKFKTWRISLTDARLLRSLDLSVDLSVHIDICPAATRGGSNVHGTRSSSNEQVQIQPCTTTMVDSKYGDVFKEAAPNNYYDYNDGPTPSAVTMMWDCPEIFLRDFSSNTCIIEIMHRQGSKLLESAQSASSSGLSLPDFICDRATSLHAYDNSAITSIPAPPEGLVWERLRWCRVERCHNLHTVFIPPQVDYFGTLFWCLTTFWASQLLTARYIWNWPSTGKRSFEDLEFLHLDYSPRLIHVLPLSADMTPLRRLNTIEIVCCGDLTEVFPLHLDHDRQEEVIVFPMLRRIHLHELPKLQRICGRRMSTPVLETVKIKGCWSLRRLPAISGNTKPLKVDCEKEWWDSLEWDGLEARHDPSLYKPNHSSYYKNTQLPRGTVLR